MKATPYEYAVRNGWGVAIRIRRKMQFKLWARSPVPINHDPQGARLGPCFTNEVKRMSAWNGFKAVGRGLILFACLIICGIAPLWAGAEVTSDDQTATQTSQPAENRASFLDKMTFGAFIDTYYGYNFNQPESRKNGLRNFDVNHNQFSLNLIGLSAELPAEPVGFRIDINFGDTAKMIHSAEPGGSDLYQFLKQAYISYKAPVGKGLTVDFGEFVTPLGAEVIESKDNWNYSRSLLFSWAIPYYHFGARLKYPFSDKFSGSAYIVNGWNDVVDNNTGKTFGFSGAINPTKKLSIVQNYMAGPEQKDDNSDWRHLWDTTVTYTVTPSLSLMGNYDYGMDRATGSRVKWQGVAGYARYQITQRFAMASRLEWYADPEGFTTGSTQKVKEGTLTAEFKVKNFLMRSEYRYDWSDRAVFEKEGNTLSRNQTTITLGAIFFIGQ